MTFEPPAQAGSAIDLRRRPMLGAWQRAEVAPAMPPIIRDRADRAGHRAAPTTAPSPRTRQLRRDRGGRAGRRGLATAPAELDDADNRDRAGRAGRRGAPSHCARAGHRERRDRTGTAIAAPLDTILVGGGIAAAPRCQGIAT
jgi:hypothetical protein